MDVEASPGLALDRQQAREPLAPLTGNAANISPTAIKPMLPQKARLVASNSTVQETLTIPKRICQEHLPGIAEDGNTIYMCLMVIQSSQNGECCSTSRERVLMSFRPKQEDVPILGADTSSNIGKRIIAWTITEGAGDLATGADGRPCLSGPNNTLLPLSTSKVLVLQLEWARAPGALGASLLCRQALSTAVPVVAGVPLFLGSRKAGQSCAHCGDRASAGWQPGWKVPVNMGLHHSAVNLCDGCAQDYHESPSHFNDSVARTTGAAAAEGQGQGRDDENGLSARPTTGRIMSKAWYDKYDQARAVAQSHGNSTGHRSAPGPTQHRSAPGISHRTTNSNNSLQRRPSGGRPAAAGHVPAPGPMEEEALGHQTQTLDDPQQQEDQTLDCHELGGQDQPLTVWCSQMQSECPVFQGTEHAGPTSCAWCRLESSAQWAPGWMIKGTAAGGRYANLCVGCGESFVTDPDSFVFNSGPSDAYDPPPVSDAYDPPPVPEAYDPPPLPDAYLEPWPGRAPRGPSNSGGVGTSTATAAAAAAERGARKRRPPARLDGADGSYVELPGAAAPAPGRGGGGPLAAPGGGGGGRRGGRHSGPRDAHADPRPAAATVAAAQAEARRQRLRQAGTWEVAAACGGPPPQRQVREIPIVGQLRLIVPDALVRRTFPSALGGHDCFVRLAFYCGGQYVASGQEWVQLKEDPVTRHVHVEGASLLPLFGKVIIGWRSSSPAGVPGRHPLRANNQWHYQDPASGQLLPLSTDKVLVLCCRQPAPTPAAYYGSGARQGWVLAMPAGMRGQAMDGGMVVTYGNPGQAVQGRWVTMAAAAVDPGQALDVQGGQQEEEEQGGQLQPEGGSKRMAVASSSGGGVARHALVVQGHAPGGGKGGRRGTFMGALPSAYANAHPSSSGEQQQQQGTGQEASLFLTAAGATTTTQPLEAAAAEPQEETAGSPMAQQQQQGGGTGPTNTQCAVSPFAAAAQEHGWADDSGDAQVGRRSLAGSPAPTPDGMVFVSADVDGQGLAWGGDSGKVQIQQQQAVLAPCEVVVLEGQEEEEGYPMQADVDMQAGDDAGVPCEGTAAVQSASAAQPAKAAVQPARAAVKPAAVGGGGGGESSSAVGEVLDTLRDIVVGLRAHGGPTVSSVWMAVEKLTTEQAVTFKRHSLPWIVSLWEEKQLDECGRLIRQMLKME